MFRAQRTRRGGLGLLLLGEKIYSNYSNGLEGAIPITLLTILGQSLLYMGIINAPWHGHQVCLSGEIILRYKAYSRLFLSAIEHSDDIHLYHNMISLFFKGRTLESRFGSTRFLILLLIFTLATSGTYVGLAWAAAQYFESYSYMKQCAIGFSGVIFALKVLTTHFESSHSRVLFFRVPSKYTVWLELILIHVLVPHTSFIGHLAGILVGIMYVYGPLRAIIDIVCEAVTGVAPRRHSYTYVRSTTRGYTLQ